MKNNETILENERIEYNSIEDLINNNCTMKKHETKKKSTIHIQLNDFKIVTPSSFDNLEELLQERGKVLGINNSSHLKEIMDGLRSSSSKTVIKKEPSNFVLFQNGEFEQDLAINTPDDLRVENYKQDFKLAFQYSFKDIALNSFKITDTTFEQTLKFIGCSSSRFNLDFDRVVCEKSLIIKSHDDFKKLEYYIEEVKQQGTLQTISAPLPKTKMGWLWCNNSIFKEFLFVENQAIPQLKFNGTINEKVFKFDSNEVTE
jgi:hypothetical protein